MGNGRNANQAQFIPIDQSGVQHKNLTHCLKNHSQRLFDLNIVFVERIEEEQL